MRLTVRSGNDAGKTIELTEAPTIIGRDPGCDLVLSDPTVSRRHASVRLGADGRAILEDLGSRAGTIVDGQSTSGAVTLEGGRQIRLGGTTLEVMGEAETVLEDKQSGSPPPAREPRPQFTSPTATATIDILASPEKVLRAVRESLPFPVAAEGSNDIVLLLPRGRAVFMYEFRVAPQGTGSSLEYRFGMASRSFGNLGFWAGLALGKRQMREVLQRIKERAESE